jgi:hypothetical protein
MRAVCAKPPIVKADDFLCDPGDATLGCERDGSRAYFDSAFSVS